MPSAVRVLCLSLLALTAATPPAAADASWSVAPSGGGRPSFYAEGGPGTVLEDTVSVTNRGGRPLTVRLTGDGVPLAFNGRTVRIPARTRADVPFTVTVPASAAPGVRYGTVVAVDPDGRTRTVPLRLRATGPELTALTVERVTVDRDGITYDLVNRGTVPLVPRLAIRADGLFGPLLDRPARPLDTTLPPASRTRLTEPWPDRPALDAVDVRLTVTAEDGTADTASASARFVPWGPVTGTAGALTAGLALGVVRRHRRAGLRGVRG